MASGLGIAAGLQLASASSGSVSGTAFLDYDADGAIGSREPGVPGVEVVAVDGAGNRSLAVMTDGDGAYEIDLSLVEAVALVRGPYRIEFAGWPAHLEETPQGPDNGSSIQFASAADTNVSLGLAEPSQYCQDNPDVAAACFVYAGDRGSMNEAAVVAVGWDWTDNNSTSNRAGPTAWQRDGEGNAVAETTLATIGEVGAVWGEAWDRDRNVIYVAAFVKRHTNLGPTGNPTTIYRIETQGTPETADDIVAPWHTVDPSAADPHTGERDGWHRDFGAFDAVLKSGLGDIDLAPDGSALYAVDLGNRALVQIPIAANGDAGSPVVMNIPANAGIDNSFVREGDCLTSDLRPAGLGISADGKVHVGIVCSAESTVDAGDYGINPNQGQIDGWTDSNIGLAAGDPRKLHGYVSVWDGDTATPVFNTVLAFPLDGPRACLAFGDTCPLGGDSEWRPWVDAYPYDRFKDSYSQPAVTDIDFDNGAMLVALVDRWGHQTGPDTRVARGSDGVEIGYRHPVAGGDLVRSCPASDGTYDLEGTAGCPTNTSGYGEREYFTDDRYQGTHRETGQGSIAVAPGFETFIHAQMDPVSANNTWRSGGFAWTDPDTGRKIKGLRIYDGRSYRSSGTFEKASGIGDVVLICDNAPITIGNRVWLDLNGNGIQDGDEIGINGVGVELLDRDGVVVARSTSTGTGRQMGSWSFGIEADTEYVVRFDASAATALPFNISPADLEVTVQSDGDRRVDNDANMAGEITVAPRKAGQNDHSLDIGYTASPETPSIDIEKLVRSANGNGEFIDADSSGPDAGVAWYQPGTAVEYSIVVTNTGPAELGPVTVADPVASGCANGPFTLAAGESREWRCLHSPPEADSGVVNSAVVTASWEPPYGPDYGTIVQLKDTDDAVVRIVRPSIGVAKSTVTGTPYVHGAEVTYTYEVTNKGDIDLALGAPVRISDDKCPAITDAGFHPTAGAPFNIGDTDADGVLDVEADGDDFDDALGTETWQFICVTNVDPQFLDVGIRDAGIGQERLDTLTNTVTVLGTPVESDGSPTGLGDISKQDDETIRIASASIEIETQVYDPASNVWRHADALDGETGDNALPATYYKGSQAEYRYVITNTGNTRLLNPMIHDSGSHIRNCDLPITVETVLESGASITVGGDGTCLSRPLTGAGNVLGNVGTVVATPVDADNVPIDGLADVKDSDPAAVRITVARIRVNKIPDNQTLLEGGEATWKFRVRNASNGIPELVNIQLTDVQSNGQECRPELFKGDTDEDGRLDRTEVWVYRCTLSGIVASGTDIATVTGEVPADQAIPADIKVLTVTDNDNASHGVGIIDLDKQVRRGDSGDWEDWTTVRIDEDVTFRVVVRNPGDVPILDVIVADDQCTLEFVQVTGDQSSANQVIRSSGAERRVLSPGEEWTFLCRHSKAEPGSVLNTATVNGTLVSNPILDGKPVPEADMAGSEAMPEVVASAGYDTVEPKLSTEISIVDGSTFDADDDAGTRGSNDGVLPILAAGAHTTVTYSVRNDSDARIFDVDITSDLPPTAECSLFEGDPAELAPGDSASYFCDYFAGAEGRTYQVTARSNRAETIDGYPLGAVTPDGDDTDRISYLVASLSLVKYVIDGSTPVDANTALDAVAVPEGADVTWQIVVTNDGEVPLTKIGVGDDLDLSGNGTTDCPVPLNRTVGDGDELAVGDSWTYECTTGPVTADIENTASVWAEALNPFDGKLTGTWVNDRDPAFVRVIPPASIGDRVWRDANGDGVQGPDEVGVAGVNVDLRDVDGTVVASTTTDSDGSYQFANVEPAVYQLRFHIPSDHAVTIKNQGVDDTIDSDISAAGLTVLTTLDPGENDLDWDAGLYVPASIGDRVWLDANADGVQDDGENGIAGVEVRLVDDSTAAPASMTTDDDGAYFFGGLAPGSYQVVVIVPETMRIAPADVSGDDATDSDIDDEGASHLVTVVSGGQDRSIDAGLYEPAEVGSYAWLDANADGFQDGGEAGLADVVLRLRDDKGAIIAATTTDHSGDYLFTGLAPGEYAIEFVTPAGLAITHFDVGDSDTADSDVDPATGRTNVLTLVSGQSDLTWDGGFVVPVVVLSSPEVNEKPFLAFTGRATAMTVGLAMLLFGFGGTARILSDRVRRRDEVGLA